jgi:hypothetical protein
MLGVELVEALIVHEAAEPRGAAGNVDPVRIRLPHRGEGSARRVS